MNEVEAGTAIRNGATGKIRVPKTSEIVADHIRAQIVRGELKEGDSLPPEGQLLVTLGISRPTLREAFRILEAEALISVVRGSRTGARAHQPSAELVARYAGYVLQTRRTTVSDFYEARYLIEPQAVRRLATNPSLANIERLRGVIGRMRLPAAGEDHAEYIAALAEFHRLLVELAGNKTLDFLNQLLFDLLARHQAGFARRREPDVEQQRKRGAAAIKSCQKLVDMIEAGDAQGAAALWERHLSNANAVWTGGEEAERIVDSIGR